MLFYCGKYVVLDCRLEPHDGARQKKCKSGRKSHVKARMPTPNVEKRQDGAAVVISLLFSRWLQETLLCSFALYCGCAKRDTRRDRMNDTVGKIRDENPIPCHCREPFSDCGISRAQDFNLFN